MFIYGILRNNLRISEDKANELAKILHDEVEKEKEKVRQEYIKKMEAQASMYENTIEHMKNESLDSMVRRIAAETVEKSIRENLSLEIHAWGGADVNGHLEWNGEEI